MLGFELRIPLPLEYLPRYLERAMNDILDGGRDEADLEDYEAWPKEEKEEFGVTELMETGLGRACRAAAVEAFVKQVSALRMQTNEW